MKAKHLFIPMFSLLFLCACTEDLVKVPNCVKVEGADKLGRKDLKYGSASSQKTIRLEVEGQWRVDIPETCDWLTVSPASGESSSKEMVEVVLSAKENFEFKSRTARIFFICDQCDQKDFLVVEQEAAFYRALNFSHKYAKVSGAPGEYTVSLDLVNVDDWTPSSAASWIKLEKKGKDQLVIKVEKATEIREADITVRANVPGINLSDQLHFRQIVADAVPDMLDIVFDENGNALDQSPDHRTIIFKNDSKVTFSKDKEFGWYYPMFSHPYAGKIPDAGVYAFKDYDMRGRFSDGYTLEAYLMCSVEPSRQEAKALSSTKDGGTALMINNSNHLAFLYNGNEEGKKNWRWVDSGIVPEVGRWYHVIGTWDQASGIARVYVDGVMKKETNYGKVKLYFSKLNEESYMCVGGNSDGGTINAPLFNNLWTGSIAVARVYSDPLTKEQVEAASINIRPGRILLHN